MHHRRASSVLSAILVIAHTVSATSPFPRAHPHAQLTSSHFAVEKRIDSVHISPRNLKSVSSNRVSTEHASAIEGRDSDSERSIFAMHSPKSLLARRMKAKQHFRRVAKRHDLTDGYGSIPELTDTPAVVDWALNGYGKDGNTLTNGYGSVPASLEAVGLGGGSKRSELEDLSSSPSKRAGLESRDDFADTFLSPTTNTVPTSGGSSSQLLSGSVVNAASGGPLVDTTSGVPIVGVASGSPPAPANRATSNEATSASPSNAPQPQAVTTVNSKHKAASNIHKSDNGVHMSKPYSPQNGADKACEVQVSFLLFLCGFLPTDHRFQYEMCCGRVLTQDDLAGRTILNDLLGLDTSGLVGLQCAPFVRNAVGLYECNGTPMCCNQGSQ